MWLSGMPTYGVQVYLIRQVAGPFFLSCNDAKIDLSPLNG